jgi:putative spermidine/putrescine transport system substrate-binding protein
MINRRTLLLASGTLTLNYLLAGCRTTGEAALRVRLLANSVPPQILQEFQRRFQTVEFANSQQLADLFKLLNVWQTPAPEKPRFGLPMAAKPAVIDDLVTLGDFWLTAAVQQLIQPLPLETISGWQQLPPAWQRLVRRDAQGQLSDTGQLWAAPYRWGSLVIAYNVEQFKQLGWSPSDWKDLWRPELKGNLSLLDSARTTIGLTLKKLGQSVNTNNLEAVPNLLTELQSLHQQVKFYSSDAYLQPLLLGDSWIGVGWSTEVLPLVERDHRIAAVVPTTGTILTADLWVRPTKADNAAAPVKEWLEFCWQPKIAEQLSLLSLAASPTLVTRDRAQLPTAIQQSPLLLPSTEVIERSEFLLPVSNTDQYRRLWETVRQMA